MDRKSNTSSRQRLAFALALVIVNCVGCGKSMLYHFKHYHQPFAAIAESNKTYFHSSNTGKIIPKDPCGKYCEPGCFGFEPTSWTHWPEECPGNLPVQGEVVGYDVPHDGQVILESSSVTAPAASAMQSNDQQASQPPAAIPPNVPIMSDPVMLPGGNVPGSGVTVPSVPTDIESSVPSPSDSTSTERPDGTTPVVAEVHGDQPDVTARLTQIRPIVVPKVTKPVVTQRTEVAPIKEHATASTAVSEAGLDIADVDASTETPEAEVAQASEDNRSLAYENQISAMEESKSGQPGLPLPQLKAPRKASALATKIQMPENFTQPKAETNAAERAIEQAHTSSRRPSLDAIPQRAPRVPSQAKAKTDLQANLAAESTADGKMKSYLDSIEAAEVASQKPVRKDYLAAISAPVANRKESVATVRSNSEAKAVEAKVDQVGESESHRLVLVDKPSPTSAASVADRLATKPLRFKDEQNSKTPRVTSPVDAKLVAQDSKPTPQRRLETRVNATQTPAGQPALRVLDKRVASTVRFVSDRGQASPSRLEASPKAKTVLRFSDR